MEIVLFLAEYSLSRNETGGVSQADPYIGGSRKGLPFFVQIIEKFSTFSTVKTVERAVKFVELLSKFRRLSTS